MSHETHTVGVFLPEGIIERLNARRARAPEVVAQAGLFAEEAANG